MPSFSDIHYFFITPPHTNTHKKGSRFLYQLPDQVTSVFIPVIMLCPLLEIVDDCGEHDAVGDQNVHREAGVDNTGQSYQKIRFHFTPRFRVFLVSVIDFRL
jgi:hypothetical protein